MSINIDSAEKCCGCTACENICPHNAISMQPDNLGFLYPVVNNNRCVECGLCEKVCQFKEVYNRYENFSSPQVYALRLLEEEQLTRSQSGGAFFAIASHFIKNGGFVYGAAFNEQWEVIHKRVDNLKDLESLRLSKYVQSNLSNIFLSVRNDLKENKTVLFTGTACQIAGIKSYIPQRLHENLYCIDIICHGVPSPQIWKDYLHYLEKKYHSKIISACFRNKRFGWHGAKETFILENGKELIRQTSNRLYFNGLSIRKSCASCKFTNLNRVGDITIGDFWGLPKDSPYEKDNRGLSLILINSLKGDYILQYIKKDCIIEPSTTQKCLQPQLQYPARLSPLQDAFIKDYELYGFKYVGKKYGDLSWKFYRRKFFNQIGILLSLNKNK